MEDPQLEDDNDDFDEEDIIPYGLPEEEEQETAFNFSGAVSAAASSSSSRKRKAGDRDSNDLTLLGVEMEITAQERQGALALRQAALDHMNDADNDDTEDEYGCSASMKEVLDRLSDMEVVQYAMMEPNNFKGALGRMRKMDVFRRQYQIQDTVEHGVACIQAFLEQQPGFSINLDQCARHKHYVHVMDFAKFDPRRVHLESESLFEWSLLFCLGAQSQFIGGSKWRLGDCRV